MLKELDLAHFIHDFWIQSIELGLNITIGFLIFCVFFVLATLAPKILFKVSGKMDKSHRHIYDILGKTIKLTILVIGAVTGLGTAGINVSALIASLGLTGFALGFALKDSVSNVLAGFIILFYKPFKIGNYVTISGKDGSVISIDLRYTTLKGKKQRILVPNASMLSSVVIIHEEPKPEANVL